MSFKILNRTEQITVVTDVEYTFDDNTKKVVRVSHFMPKNEDDIIKGIENRFETEKDIKNNKEIE